MDYRQLTSFTTFYQVEEKNSPPVQSIEKRSYVFFVGFGKLHNDWQLTIDSSLPVSIRCHPLGISWGTGGAKASSVSFTKWYFSSSSNRAWWTWIVISKSLLRSKLKVLELTTKDPFQYFSDDNAEYLQNHNYSDTIESEYLRNIAIKNNLNELYMNESRKVLQRYYSSHSYFMILCHWFSRSRKYLLVYATCLYISGVYNPLKKRWT